MIFDRHARAALVVAIAALAVSGVGFRYAVRAANAYLKKDAVPLRDQLTNIPKRLGGWEAVGVDRKLTADIVEQLGTPYYVERHYRRVLDGREIVMHLLIVYYTGLIDAIPHIPDRCLVAGGMIKETQLSNVPLEVDRVTWTPDREHVNRRTGEPYPLVTYRHAITGQPVTVRMPIGPLELRAGRFQDPEYPDKRVYAGYFFIANGQTTPSPERVRGFAFDLQSSSAYYAKVQFSMYASKQVEPEEYIEFAESLLDPLLPELMRCLPDWAEVEAAEASGKTQEKTRS